MAISRIESNSIAPSQTLTTPIIATTMGVGGATPAGSGSGITFPASQSASSDANTLDDYEEGTWTPVLKCTSVNPTYTATVAQGKYTKIGNVVYYNFYLYASGGATGGSGDVYIGGNPFTPASGVAPRGLPSYLYWGNTARWNQDTRNGLGWSPTPSSADIALYAAVTAFSNGVFELGGCGFYYV